MAVPLNDVRVVWQSGEPVTRWGVFRYKDWDFVKRNADAYEDSLVRMVTDLWDGKDCRIFFMGYLFSSKTCVLEIRVHLFQAFEKMVSCASKYGFQFIPGI